MKKLGFITLGLSLALATAACGNKEEPKADNQKENHTSATTDTTSDAASEGEKGNKGDDDTPKIGGKCQYYGGLNQCIGNDMVICTAEESGQSGVYQLVKSCPSGTVCSEYMMDVQCFEECQEGAEKQLQACQADDDNEEFTAEWYECTEHNGKFIMAPSLDKEYCSECGEDGECIKDFDDGADLMPTEECDIRSFVPRCEEEDDVSYAFNCVEVTNGEEIFYRVALKACENGCATYGGSSMFARPSAICDETVYVDEDDEDLSVASFCYYSFFDFDGEKAIQIYFAQNIEITYDEVDDGYISGIGVVDDKDGRALLQDYIDDFDCQFDENLHMFF